MKGGILLCTFLLCLIGYASCGRRALTEDSAFLYMSFTRDSAVSTSASDSMELFVDSHLAFAFSVFSPAESQMTLTLTDPNGNNVPLDSHAHKGGFPIGYQQVPGTTYTFLDPKPGTWTLSISVAGWTQRDLPTGAVILWNHSQHKLYTSLNTYDLQLGSQIGLVSRISDKAENLTLGESPVPLKDVVMEAVMDVDLPDGQEVEVKMHDDGLHYDGEANDGIWGGQIDATEVGTYSVQAIITGQDNNGRKFIRSTQHLIPVVPNEVELSGNAVAEQKDNTRLLIHLGVSATSAFQPVDALFRAYAEVWGTDSSNNDVAACWIESLVYMDEQSDGSYTVTLELNTDWLKRAGVTAPLTLKNVYIADATVHVPVTEMSEIPVSMSEQARKLLMAIPPKKMNIPITKEMRQGVRPSRAHVNRTQAAPSLMLVHGYCADSNPFDKYADFTNAAFFLQKLASLDNNKFAELVAEYADSLGMTSYGIIGHSQGGTVSLHLLNYFFTGLDDATGTRLIQSVGTPWKGCSAAGSAANLGKAFGVGCGSNPDLTTDGANLWLSGLDKENFKLVNFYTTSYEQGNFFGDYCNLAVNLVLQWPNDGVTEIKYAKLDGGNNLGNKEKWCHTVDMSYPAQYYDRARNAEMNSLASR